MKLSTLAALEQSEPLVYGIEVDCDILTPPKGLTQVGLLYKGGEEIDDTMIDAIIAFSLAGIDVIVEVAPTQAVDAKTLLTLAGNAGFSVALIPPTQPEDCQAWYDTCAQWAKAFLSVSNFTGQVYPVSGYFGYLVASKGTGVNALIPTDPYVTERFFAAVPESWADDSKTAMKQAFEEKTGGPDALDGLLSGLITGILMANIDILDDWEKQQQNNPSINTDEATTETTPTPQHDQ